MRQIYCYCAQLTSKISFRELDKMCRPSYYVSELGLKPSSFSTPEFRLFFIQLLTQHV